MGTINKQRQRVIVFLYSVDESLDGKYSDDSENCFTSRELVLVYICITD